MDLILSRRSRRRAPGFTLVELLIVVIILAILAAIVVPQFATSTDDARDAALDSTVANLRDVIDIYFAQHGEYPAAKSDGANGANTEKSFVNQLARYSDGEGRVSDAKDPNFPYGPYLKLPLVPMEPMSNSRGLVIVTVGNLTMSADPGDPGGWKYDSVTGKIIVNHSKWQDR